MVKPIAPIPQFRPRPAREVSKAPVSKPATEKPAPSGPVFSSEPKKGYEPSPLFPNKAVSGNTQVDSWIKDHPLCKGLDNRSLARIRNLIDDMDVKSHFKVLNYGDALRTKFANLIDDIVRSAQNDGVPSDVYDDMEAVLAKIQSVDVDTIFNQEPITWWDVLTRKATLTERKQRFSPAYHSGRITKVVSDVEYLVEDMAFNVDDVLAQIDALESMYVENHDNFKLLTLHVIAGKLYVEDQENRVIPHMKKTLDEKDLFKCQDFLYYKDCVSRFKDKVSDLEMIADTMVLKAPQIRQMQMSARTFAENIRRLSKTMIPHWRMQYMALAQKLQVNRHTKLAAIESELNQKQTSFLTELKTLQYEVKSDFTK